MCLALGCVTCISSCPSYYYNYMQMTVAEHCDGRDDIWAGPWSLAKVWNCGKRGREARRGTAQAGAWRGAVPELGRRWARRGVGREGG